LVSVAIWWAAIFLEALILLHGFRKNLLSKYPMFYVYLLSLFFSDLLLYIIFTTVPASYHRWYWSAEILKELLACGLILEVFRHALSAYPGARRLAQAVGVLTFGIVFSFLLACLAISAQTTGTRATCIEFERDSMTIQAILILGILGVVFYYRIPMGRNLKGIIFGYGLSVGTSLMTLAVRSYAGASFNHVWMITEPLSYDVSLLIWLAALWAYHPNPAPDSAVHLEEDYEAFVARTRSMIGALRAHLARVAHP
jgi:hypothetical protein